MYRCICGQERTPEDLPIAPRLFMDGHGQAWAACIVCVSDPDTLRLLVDRARRAGMRDVTA